MIKVTSHGTLEERVQKLEQSVNYSEVILGVCVPTNFNISFGTPVAVQAISVDRSWSRLQFPDAQWVVRAAGFINPTDVNGVRVDLLYQTNATAFVTLGSATYTGAGFVKQALDPFDVFGTGGVPAGETIPVLAIQFTKLVSGTASVVPWTFWLELRPSKQ